MESGMDDVQTCTNDPRWWVT